MCMPKFSGVWMLPTMADRLSGLLPRLRLLTTTLICAGLVSVEECCHGRCGRGHGSCCAAGGGRRFCAAAAAARAARAVPRRPAPPLLRPSPSLRSPLKGTHHISGREGLDAVLREVMRRRQLGSSGGKVAQHVAGALPQGAGQHRGGNQRQSAQPSEPHGWDARQGAVRGVNRLLQPLQQCAGLARASETERS